MILRNGQRLLKLVNTLLDFSRLESGRVEARFEPVDLARYTRELASMFDTAAERLGLDLVVDVEPLPQPVYVDRDLWAKVVLNLLSNAMKFTFEGEHHACGSRHPAARPTGARRGELTVTDTGTGIPDARAAAPVRALPPGLRCRVPHPRGLRHRARAGRGARRAARWARVTPTARLGEGSTFTVRLPFGAAHLPAEQVVRLARRARRRRSPPWPRASSPRPRTGSARDTAEPARSAPDARTDLPRILVVDDNADIREYVAGLLARRLRRADRRRRRSTASPRPRPLPPDLVLTDVMMPRMDGFELLAALQADPVTVGVPVVMLSARAGEEGTLQGLDAGADDYLVKPFTARELLPASAPTSSSTAPVAPVGSWSAAAACSTRRSGWPGSAAGRSTWPPARVEASEEFLRILGRSEDESPR